MGLREFQGDLPELTKLPVVTGTGVLAGTEYAFRFQSPSLFLLTGEPEFHRLPAKVTQALHYSGFL